MTTSVRQQLLLYVLLALLLPQATYENRSHRSEGEGEEARTQWRQVRRAQPLEGADQLPEASSAGVGKAGELGAKSGESVANGNADGHRKHEKNLFAKSAEKETEKVIARRRQEKTEKVQHKIAEKATDENRIATKKLAEKIATKIEIRITKKPAIKRMPTEDSKRREKKHYKSRRRFLKQRENSSAESRPKIPLESASAEPKATPIKRHFDGDTEEETSSAIIQSNPLIDTFESVNLTQRIKRHPQLQTSAQQPHPEAQRRASGLQSAQLTDFKSQFSLPTVPLSLPPPPPFDYSFAVSPFGGAAAKEFPNLFQSNSASAPRSSSTASSEVCGGLLRQAHGIIQTPNFPRRFRVPIECVWIIDASELTVPSAASSAGSSASSNVTIAVYLTQLYVLGSLTFTEYMYYSDDYKVPAHRVFRLTEDDVTQLTSLQFYSQYLEVRFSMFSLDGTHLRALDRLLDVYGFNITYEVQQQVKAYQCNTLQCRFLGHCFAHDDFSSYYCACFDGFSGTDCGAGPLCEDPHTNICQNGGSCKHIGDAAITCHCPVGYRGTKCEIPELKQTTMGCTTNSSSSDCHLECNLMDGRADTRTAVTRREGRTLARSGKTRYEVTIRLGANLTAFYRITDGERRPGDHLPSLLERYLSRVLRNFNITKISDLELISNSTDRLDITFHFFGIKGDSVRIREAITRMVERGRIGNITLVSNYHLFDENPPLHLLDMTINQKSAIREGSEFIISCTAQGSSKMQFQWFKDGATVNASKAVREIWTTVLPPETRDVYTAILGVTKASLTDEGVYTCKVIDWGIEQCRSLHIHIKSPPRVRVDPASVTLHRGDSLRVRCLSPGTDDVKRYAQLGYSWTRNGQLFQSDPATVMWEDLYPDGSILKINNIQKSAEYACIVSNSVRPVAKSVYVTVIDRNVVRLCRAETAFAVRWPTSAPGAAIVSECPKGFDGHSRRVCEKRDYGNSSWLQPDFSFCISDELLQVDNTFQSLKSGFQRSNSSDILKACFKYVNRRHKEFLPGEAAYLIDMLNAIDAYLQLKGTQLEREMAAEIILHILDKVMQNAVSLNSQQQIKKLQLLTQSAALNRETIAASQLATSTSSAANSASSSFQATLPSSSSSGVSSNAAEAVASASAADRESAAAASSSSSSPSTTSFKTASKQQNDASSLFSKSGSAVESRRSIVGNGSGSASGVVTADADSLSLDRLNSLRIYMMSVKTLPFNLRIYGDDLFSDQLYMEIGLSSRLLNALTNSTIFASVISYKNLKNFLPQTYHRRSSDTTKDTDYVLASRIIQTWLFQSNRSNDNLRVPLDLSFEAGHVEIIFQHESPLALKDNGDWLPVCGHDYKASFESTWRSDLCITKNLMRNLTRCICPLSGTYVVMLTKRNLNASMPQSQQRPVFVIVSCSCCLLQSCTAFAILLPLWYNRKCAITFLKMQFCVSTSSVMLIFLLGFLKMLPVNMQAIVSSSLASLLLFGISTLIAIALVIHLEMVPQEFRHHVAAARTTTTKPTAAAAASLLANKQENAHINSSNINSNNNNSSSSSKHSLSSSSINGAIGISWLLPLFFAISSPLICSITDKWPQNWWLEVMTNATETPTASIIASSSETSFRNALLIPDEDFFGRTDEHNSSEGLFNGQHLLQSIVNQNATTTAAAATKSASTTVANTTAAIKNIAAATTATMTLFPPLTTLSLDQQHDSNVVDGDGAATATTTAGNFAAAAATAITATTAPSVIFIIFTIIDLFFVLLFAALVITLMKKLLWLLRKYQLPHQQQQQQQQQLQNPHPLGKLNTALNRRIGLLYRSSLLLIIKSTTDALFIVYVNSTQDSGWSYAFGVASMLLGLSILCCFVIRAECNLRSAASAGNTRTSAETLKTKLSSSKTSLNENYCTESINNPLNFYANQGTEKDNDCGAPMPLTTILTGRCHPTQTLPPSSVQLPLTIISTAPRCQVIAGGLKDHPGAAAGPRCSVDSFLGGSLERNKQQHHQQQFHHAKEQLRKGNAAAVDGAAAAGGLVASPASRCCRILGGGSNASSHKQTVAEGILSDNSPWQTPMVGISTAPAGSIVYYDPAFMGGITGSLGRRGTLEQYNQQQPQVLYQQHQPQKQRQLLNTEGHHEFVGVETLDILQGVAQDSIAGIRTGNMLATHQMQPHQTQQYYQQLQNQLALHHKPFLDTGGVSLSPVLIGISSNASSTTSVANYTTSKCNTNNISSSSNTATIATNSVMTQTPKTQKRVTIHESTTHTFDPLMPTITATAGSTTAAEAPHRTASAPCFPKTPIITITCLCADEATSEATSSTAAVEAAAVTANKAALNSTLSTGGATTTSSASVSAMDAVTTVEENSITGMFDRISHDLDYLLNRTDEATIAASPLQLDGDVTPSPAPPTAGSKRPKSPTTTRAASIQHQVIIEELEQE